MPQTGQEWKPAQGAGIQSSCHQCQRIPGSCCLSLVYTCSFHPRRQRLPWLLHSSSLVGWQMEATTPTPPWLTADCIQPGRRASRSLGKGGVRSRDPSILTKQAVQQQQVWLGQLSSPLSFAVSKKQITLKVGRGEGVAKHIWHMLTRKGSRVNSPCFPIAPFPP